MENLRDRLRAGTGRHSPNSTTPVPSGSTITWPLACGRRPTPMTCCRRRSCAWPGTATEAVRCHGLYPYLFAIARNEASRLIERRVREGRGEAELQAEMLFPMTRSGTESRETAELVAALLDRLELPVREIVELKVFGGLTFREISEVTGLPQGTVATRYRLALEKMRGQAVKEWR